MNLSPTQSSQPVFDPLAAAFTAQQFRPENLVAVDSAALSPYQRALLVIDGTVTRFIEAYTGEAVEIVCLQQSGERLAEDCRWLAAPAGAEVVRRSVVLRGTDGGRTYVWADSLMVVDRLPGDLIAALVDEPRGLGKLLHDRNLENRRECLWYGLDRRRDKEFLSRTYRVISGGVPLLRITERFPFDNEN